MAEREKKKPWVKLLFEEYKFRFVNPFYVSGLFVLSLLLILTIGFFGSWMAVYSSLAKENVVQDVVNKAFCGSVISLVVVSCLDVLLIFLNREQEESQKRIPISDVTYVISILISSGFCVLIAIGGIVFSSTVLGTILMVVSVVVSLVLWVQVNATNPIYFESENDMLPESAVPDLPKVDRPNPYKS